MFQYIFFASARECRYMKKLFSTQGLNKQIRHTFIVIYIYMYIYSIKQQNLGNCNLIFRKTTYSLKLYCINFEKLQDTIVATEAMTQLIEYV